jgi:prepilin-type N-terminal cleavage/methylation domain-containing protein
MKNENGFSLIELLIVVAIIAIIAAIAVPSLLTSRMAANEAGAIQGLRTVGSAEIAYAATNNQMFVDLPSLIAQNFLDSRYTNGIDGYTYADTDVTTDTAVTFAATTAAGTANFAVVATPLANMGRFDYGIATDQVVRYIGVNANAAAGTALPAGAVAGSGIGAIAAAAS